jgi:DNA-binding NtrC family response regulator
MNRSVLVVDDDADIREALRDILSALRQYDVVEAATAHEALAVLERDDRAYVVILDLDLPDIPGEEVSRRVQAQSGHRVVLIICSADAKEIGRLRDDGLDTVLKPFAVDTIIAAVERAFQQLEAAGHRFNR